MKGVRFEIKNHSDRMDILKALQDNGYHVHIETDTAYMPPKAYVYVEVAEHEVIEE